MEQYYCTDTNIAISKQVHKQWRKLLNVYGKLYLYAMSGFGKSVNALAFANENYKQWTYISADEQDFLEKIEQYCAVGKATKLRTLLVIDDLQWVTKKQQAQLLQLLSSIGMGERKQQCLLLSRSDLPEYLKPLYLTKQLAIESKEALWLDQQQIELLLDKENIALEEERQALAKESLRISKGYPIAVSSVMGQLKQGYRDFDKISAVTRQDLSQYYDRILWVKWSEEQVQGLIKLAVYEQFNQTMAEAVLGSSAKTLLESVLQISSCLKRTPPDTYEFQPFFLNYLRNKQAQLTKQEYNRIYVQAAKCYETSRDRKEALRCYCFSGNLDKVAQMIIDLSENVDPDFVTHSEAYINILPEDLEEKLPKLLGAKTLLYSYQMNIEKSNWYLEKLKQKASLEMKQGKKGEMLKTYVRTLVALPHGTSEEMKEKLTFFSSYVLKYGIHLDNIIPTGNMPSVMNGGLDFLSWEKNDRILYPIMKSATELAVGKEAVGLAEVCMGENLYEKNKRAEAITYLTKGLSLAEAKGSIRVQYAAIGVMARLFQCEGQGAVALDNLRSIYDKAQNSNFLELLPNMRASLVHCALLKDEKQELNQWLTTYAPDEHQKFYITKRFGLLTKAKVYMSQSRYAEALYVLSLLQQYATLYKRPYLQMEINLLKAIILYRQSEQWQMLLIETIKKAETYSYIHIVADHGIALLPLWKSIDWEAVQLKKNYIESLNEEIRKMAELYPDYLMGVQQQVTLSNKEVQVLQLLAQGHTNTEISVVLDVSVSTVKFHIANILKKLNVENRVAAVNIAKDKKLFSTALEK